MRQLTEGQTDRLLDDVDDLRQALSVREANALYCLAGVAPELRSLLGTLAAEVRLLEPWETLTVDEQVELHDVLVPWLALVAEAGVGLSRDDYEVEV